MRLPSGDFKSPAYTIPPLAHVRKISRVFCDSQAGDDRKNFLDFLRSQKNFLFFAFELASQFQSPFFFLCEFFCGVGEADRAEF